MKGLSKFIGRDEGLEKYEDGEDNNDNNNDNDDRGSPVASVEC